MRLNEEIKSYFRESGAMKLNILVLLMGDLLMALRDIVVEISILPVVVFFLLEARIVRIVIQYNFMATEKSKHMTSAGINVQIRFRRHPVMQAQHR